MAIDPNISLGLRPYQGTDPLESVGKILTLRTLMAQGPLREQQLKAAQLENAQREQGLGATQAMNQAYATSVNPDGSLNRDQITQALAAKGYGSQIPGVLKHFADAEKSLADVTKIKGEVAIQEADYAGSIAAAARAAKNDPNILLAGLSHAKAQGYKTVEPLIAALQQNPEAAPAIIERLIAGSPKQRQIMAQEQTAATRATTAATGQAREKREGDRQAALLPGEVEEQGLKLTEAQQKVTGTQPETTHEVATREETARHNKVEEGQGARRLQISGAEQGIRQKTFDATYGALVGPDGKPLEPEAAKRAAEADPLAVAVANYQTAPPATGRGGPGASILRKALAINPDYNAQNWQQQRDFIRDYGPGGKVGKSLVSTNVALGHLNALADANEALNNGDIQVLNRMANGLGVAVGKTPKATFDTIVHRVGPEIAAAYGEGTGGERGKVESDFSSNNSPDQNKANIAATANLFRSKIAASEAPWKQVMGSRPMPVSLNPEATRAMARVAGKPAGLAVGQSVTLKNGKTVKVTAVHEDGSFDAQ